MSEHIQPSTEPSIDRLRQLVREVAPEAREEDLGASEPLVTGRILDSMITLELVGRLEEEYGIAIDAHEVDVENFDTLERIRAFVVDKLGE